MLTYKPVFICLFFFFFNDTATTEIYTLSLHDALPILLDVDPVLAPVEQDLGDEQVFGRQDRDLVVAERDRKSTRLNSSHANISYAVFCLKKKTAIQLYNPLPYAFAITPCINKTTAFLH